MQNSVPLVLVLPLPSHVVSRNSRAHRMIVQASTRTQRGDAKLVAIDAMNRAGLNKPKWKRARIDVVIHKPGSHAQAMDLDNTIGWLKGSLDGIQDSELIKNDSGVEWGSIEHVLGKAAKERKVVMTITPLED